MSLAQKGFSSFVYEFSGSIISKIIFLAGGIYLARLLSPNDYGLVAMLYIIFSISNFLISGGMGLALIREKEVNENDKATVFYFNILVSIFLYILLWLCAPLIADFYNKPQLIFLSRLMGLDLLFKSLTIVQYSILKRELKFKVLSLISIASGILVILTAIVLAYNGFGVKALAIKFMLGSLISSIMLFIFNPWLPIGFINKKSFKKLFAFGSNVMILGFINNISGNLHQVIIGKYFSTSALGFFNQGNMLKDNVANTLNDSVMNVTFPMLAKLQDDKKRLKKGYQRIMRINSFTIFPLITILILTAEPLILVLLGEKWRGSIIFLQILGISGYVRHLHSINLNILKVFGKGKDYLFQGFFRNGITILGVIIAVNFSVVAMAWAFVFTEFLQLFVNAYYSNKYLKFRLTEQISLILPLAFLSIFMGFLVYLIGQINFETELIKLIIMLITGFASYALISYTIKLDAFEDFKNILLEKIKS